MILEGTILSVLAPAIVDLIKNGFGAITRKWIGLSVDDQIKLQNSDIQKLQALASLDNPYGTPSQWVIDLRASFRYIAAGASILAGVAIMLLPELLMGEIGAQLVTMPFGFIFGERMYLTLTGKAK